MICASGWASVGRHFVERQPLDAHFPATFNPRKRGNNDVFAVTAAAAQVDLSYSLGGANVRYRPTDSSWGSRQSAPKRHPDRLIRFRDRQTTRPR